MTHVRCLPAAPLWYSARLATACQASRRIYDGDTRDGGYEPGRQATPVGDSEREQKAENPGFNRLGGLSLLSFAHLKP